MEDSGHVQINWKLIVVIASTHRMHWIGPVGKRLNAKVAKLAKAVFMPFLHWTNQDTAMGAAKHSFGMKYSMFYHLPRFGTQPPPTHTQRM